MTRKRSIRDRLKIEPLREQVRRNAVALISLAVAITGLGYNTWRNEQSEDNRNRRWAAFEILLKTSELQELTFLVFYDCDTSLRGNVRTGWAHVLTLQDLTLVLEDDMVTSVDRLQEIWQKESRAFDFAGDAQCRDKQRRAAAEPSVIAVRDALQEVRDDARRVLAALE